MNKLIDRYKLKLNRSFKSLNYFQSLIGKIPEDLIDPKFFDCLLSLSKAAKLYYILN